MFVEFTIYPNYSFAIITDIISLKIVMFIDFIVLFVVYTLPYIW